MRQIDAPCTALCAIGQHTTATLYTILLRDMLTNVPYRTNKELGVLLGVGEKRVVQLLDQLERFGLARVEAAGRKRHLALSCVLNDRFVREADMLLTGSEDPLWSEQTPAAEEAQTAFRDSAGRVTAHLLRVNHGLYLPDWPKPKTVVSFGYVTSWDGGTDLAFYYTTTGTTLYTYRDNNNKECVTHADLPGELGLASLAVKRKKHSASGKTYDQMPKSSFGFRFFPKDKLALDTEYHDTVLRVLGIWDQNLGTHTPIIGETYRLVRQCLAEHTISPDELVRAVENFTRDPWWRDKRPGLATFFDKPARVLEFANKSAAHDRFARNLGASPADYADQVVDGVIPF